MDNMRRYYQDFGPVFGEMDGFDSTQTDLVIAPNAFDSKCKKFCEDPDSALCKLQFINPWDRSARHIAAAAPCTLRPGTTPHPGKHVCYNLICS